MDPIETAIRNAFEKGDPGDAAFREKVYRSAFAALDRALQANPGTTVERAIARRKELQAKVRQIETAFLAPPDLSVAVERDEARAGAASAAMPAPEAARRGGEGGRIEPSLGDGLSAGGFGPAELSRAGEPADAFVAVDPDQRRAVRRKKRWGLPAALVLVAAVLGLGGWWIAGQGLLPSGARDGTPPRTVEDEIAGEEPGGGGPLSSSTETRDWVNLFTPADPSALTVPADGEARPQDEDGIPYMRVRSGSGGEAARLRVDRGVLAKLAGRKAVFDIVARAQDGTDTQVAVECDFGGFGTCGRRRYAVTDATRADFLFDVEFPAGAPAGDGTILVDTDVSEGDKAVDIYEIRVSASD